YPAGRVRHRADPPYRAGRRRARPGPGDRVSARRRCGAPAANARALVRRPEPAADDPVDRPVRPADRAVVGAGDRGAGAGPARQLRLRGARPIRRRSRIARRPAHDRPGIGRRFPAADCRVAAAPPDRVMIELDHVSKAFGGRPVVDDLSLTVPDGAFCVVLGPSGCGKSTTLRMINRLVPFDSGVIRIAGEDVRAVPPEALRRRIGYAIQSIGLFPHWPVEDNIATVPRLLGWPRARLRDRVTELLELLRLDPESYRHKYPHQLSGGEQQRIGVARALAADPELLLMDEPFGAVDPITRDVLQSEIARIHAAT